MALVRVIDFETTGMEPPAEVIEIGWQDMAVEEGGVALLGGGSALFQAERPIPPETMAVHHILPDQVAGQPFCTPDILRLYLHRDAPTVIVAHNADFEAKWATPEVLGSTPLLCTLKAALRVWPDAPSHSNQALMYWLGLHGEMDADRRHPPHRAGPDAYVTAHILKALLAHTTGREMVAWTKEPRLLPTCPIGKFRGKAWREVDDGFLNWMLGQATMEDDLKWNARRELDRRRAA